jgi:hypothetical protein
VRSNKKSTVQLTSKTECVTRDVVALFRCNILQVRYKNLCLIVFDRNMTYMTLSLILESMRIHYQHAAV